MRRFTNDDRNEEGRELIPAQREGEGATLLPSFEGMDSDQVMSRRRMLQLGGGALAGAAIALTSGLNIATKDAQAWWNTGCRYIQNRTSTTLYVVDLEDTWHKLWIPPNDTRYFDGVIFPWCNSYYEVSTKAFLFRSGSSSSPRLFYMFQNYHSNEVHWLPASSTNFADRRWAGAFPSSYVDVTVSYVNGRPEPRATTA